MCNLNALQQKIFDRTKEGDTIAKFLVDTMQGETPGVKVNHRLEAAKHLIKYGFTDTRPTLQFVIPAQAGTQRGRAATKPPSKVPSPWGEG